ncbi:MAG TPA: hypothetical protein VEA15_06530 [Caulobacteraceae bacterium]|nr:hypothetical protein [Caulobacteraceae bacterium]
MSGLEWSLVAGGLGAFAGAMAGVLVISGSTVGDLEPGAAPAPLDRRLSIGAFLLSSHAIAAAGLWQLPTVGSCLAAGLGAGWMGAAAAGLVGMLTQTDKIGLRMSHIVLRACVGVTLLAPLWAYVKLLAVGDVGPTTIA